MEKNVLNEIYKKLDFKRIELISPFISTRLFMVESGYYNGHYYKGENDEYEMTYYPIPVISIKGYCDIEVNLDSISISTKMKKNDALIYNYEKIKKYRFEVYGVENYLVDYYTKENTINDLLVNLKESKEKEFGFAFYFDYDIDRKKIFEFVKLLRREGFYY